MRIDEQARQCVSFLSIREDASQADLAVYRPVGTAFYVGVNVGGDQWVQYVVTAKHVVDSARPYGGLYIRLSGDDGEPRTTHFPSDDWSIHPKADVAVAYTGFDIGEFGLQFLPTALFATKDWMEKHQVGVGDRLAVSGMFSQYFGTRRDEPVLRFGRISLLPTETIRVPPQGGVPGMELEAILAEVQAWGGQSGSPVFVYFSIDRSLFAGDRLELKVPNPRLLGLVHGHYIVRQSVFEKDERYPNLQVPLNAGIALVIPASKVLETLMMDELVEKREDLKTRLRQQGLID